jgi:hypothetical protein
MENTQRVQMEQHWLAIYNGCINQVTKSGATNSVAQSKNYQTYKTTQQSQSFL